jgi:exopolyphosphatase/guanosine-5'-triphosphate,3'-diphosphate pyrophosphatase
MAVLDVGSNTVHLLIVDAHSGAAPIPFLSQKYELKLAERINSEGNIRKAAVKELIEVMHECQAYVTEHDCVETLAFATSAVREAGNSDEILDAVRNETGIDLQVLDGDHEAILTFLAVRRWYGWSSGRMLVADIGGGSFEIAVGTDEHPEFATSMPIGAGRLTRDFFTSDPPSDSETKALRKHVREVLASQFDEILSYGQPDHLVATSKTFRQLARIAGAASSLEGPRAKRVLQASDLAKWVPRLADMTSSDRAKLPGVSVGRAEQLLAGAIVAQEAMEMLRVAEFEICPWALREGIILRRLDWFSDDA